MMKFCCFIFVVNVITLSAIVGASGFDSIECDPHSTRARTGRARLIASIPCDLTKQNYCNLPGEFYPWNAVKKFVYENQGLVRRMYGDLRHIFVMQSELENEIESNDDDLKHFADKYSKAFNVENDSSNRRQMKASKKVAERKNYRSEGEPYFRPAQRPTAINSKQKTKPPPKVNEQVDNNVLNDDNLIKNNEEQIVDDDDNMRSKMSTATAATTERITKSTTTSTTTTTTSSPTVTKKSDLPVNSSMSSSSTTTEFSSTIQPTTKPMTSSSSVAAASAPQIPLDSNENESDQSGGDLLVQSSNSDKIVFFNNTSTTSILASSPHSSSIPPYNSNDETKSIIDELEQEVENELRDALNVDNTTNERNTSREPQTTTTEAQLFQDTIYKEKEPTPVVNRKGVNACPVKEEILAPFWGNSTRGEVLALLNVYPYEQYINWEKCTNEHEQMYCRRGCKCEQQYRLHRLLAYNPLDACRGVFSDWFRFPSCCICKCYDIPFDFRVTSRSPRGKIIDENETSDDELLTDLNFYDD